MVPMVPIIPISPNVPNVPIVLTFPIVPLVPLVPIVLPFCPVHKKLNFAETVLFLEIYLAVNMTKRECCDFPFPNCGAKYLVKLSNYLKDVNELDHINRKKKLQEAKLQTNRSQGLKRSGSETPLSVQEEKHKCQRKKNTRGSAIDHISYRKQPGTI